MSKEPSFVKEAFKRQENVVSLAGFAVAGALFNPGFLLLGAALEIAYLWALSTNPRFQRTVRAGSARLIDETERQRIVNWLPERDRAVYRDLEDTCRRVHDGWLRRDSVSKSILQPSVEKLDYLLFTYVKTVYSLHQLQDYVDRSNRSLVEKELKMLEAQLAGEMPAKLRDATQKNVEILKQRVARLDKLKEEAAVMRAQIKTLDNAIRFVADQSMSTSDPHELNSQIDSVVLEAEQTERTVEDSEVFLQAQRQIDAQRTAQAQK